MTMTAQDSGEQLNGTRIGLQILAGMNTDVKAPAEVVRRLEFTGVCHVVAAFDTGSRNPPARGARAENSPTATAFE